MQSQSMHPTKQGSIPYYVLFAVYAPTCTHRCNWQLWNMLFGLTMTYP